MTRRQGAPAGVAVILLVSACGGQAASSVDGPVYDTVTALTERADLVVTGSPAEVVAREVDGGGNDESVDGSGTSTVFWSVRVDSVLAGDAVGEVVVAWPEQGGDVAESATPVEAGQSLVLFLEQVSAGDAPGITSVDGFYLPVGGDQGVFDVRGADAVARSPEVRGLADPEEGDAALRVPVADLEAVVSAGAG